MEARAKNTLGRHNVERLEARNSRQQIEIGDEEPLGVGDPIGNGDENSGDRPRRRFVDQTLAQQVFIDCAGFTDPPFVFPKGSCEKRRLLAHSLGAAIDIARSKRLRDECLEPIDVLRLTPQQIVEAKHFGNETWSQPKSQVGIARGGARRTLRHHVALDCRKPPRCTRQPRVQPVVHLVPGDGRGRVDL